jgi:pyruvate formate lyase activating enzyme
MIDEIVKTCAPVPFSRRDFLKAVAGGTAFFSLAGFPVPTPAESGRRGFLGLKLSPYFIPLEKGHIQCQLCPRECVVPEGKRGFCRVRENRNGKYYSLVYGNPCAIHVDPIEKKPFYHIVPSSSSFSIATAGCNLKCKFCQNWEISQATPEETYNQSLPPQKVVALAKKTGSRSIAYTYVEPTIFFEYMMDTARLAKKEGILNVMHSNGFINPTPLRALCRFLDGANIDLKGFTEDYYRNLTLGKLQPVLRTLQILHREGVHIEITNLVVPTQNDAPGEVRKMCEWIRVELGPEIPLHFSRFYPLYKLRNLPPTPVSTLERNRKIALETGLEYVYIGNVPGHEGEKTFCPACKKVLILRQGYTVTEVRLNKGKCRFCGRAIPGIWA